MRGMDDILDRLHDSVSRAGPGGLVEVESAWLLDAIREIEHLRYQLAGAAEKDGRWLLTQVEAEREACAKRAEWLAGWHRAAGAVILGSEARAAVCEGVAAAIRARGGE